MSRIAPFLRTAILCQRVKLDAHTRPHVTLFEPLHTITLPADRFDRPLSEMVLYTQLEDAIGTFEFSVRVENENRVVVPQPNLVTREHTFQAAGEERIIPFELDLVMFGLVFPAPGVYYFIVRADTGAETLHQRDNAARAPFLRVLRA